MARKRRSRKRIVDEAVQVVLAYNRALMLDYDTNWPTVWLEIGGRRSPEIKILDGDMMSYAIYSDKRAEPGRTFEEGIAAVKQLLHKHKENADGVS